MSTKYFFVVGLKDFPSPSGVAYLKTRSVRPAEDIEKALSLGCGYAVAKLRDSEEAEMELTRYVDLLRSQETENREDEHFQHRRLKSRTPTYRVVGFSSDPHRLEPGTGTILPYGVFLQEVSASPSEDVKRALNAGSTTVTVGVNYDPSEEELMEEERNLRLESERDRSKEQLRNQILNASAPTAARQFAVVGFAKHPETGVVVGQYLMPMTSTPGIEIGRALNLKCHWISVSLLSGRLRLAKAIADYEISFDRFENSQFEDPFRSFPIPQPPQKSKVPSRRGLTVCRVVGTSGNSEGASQVRWSEENSESPAESVEKAIRNDASEVVVEVKSWGLGRTSGVTRRARSHGTPSKS